MSGERFVTAGDDDLVVEYSANNSSAYNINPCADSGCPHRIGFNTNFVTYMTRTIRIRSSLLHTAATTHIHIDPHDRALHVPFFLSFGFFQQELIDMKH